MSDASEGQFLNIAAFSRQRFKKVFRADGERPRQLNNIFQANVPFAPFYATNVVAM